MNKKNIVLLGIFAGLLLAAWLVEGPVKEWRENSGKEKNIVENIDFTQIDRVELKDGGESYAFVKNNNRWKIDGTFDFYLSDTQASTIESKINDSFANAPFIGENQDIFRYRILKEKGSFGVNMFFYDFFDVTVILKQKY